MSYININNFSKAVRFIYDRIDQPIQLDAIASHVGISVSSLKRLFEQTAEQTPGAFIRRLRMELAFRSLQNRDDTILGIALAAGFDDQAAFARCFKQMFGYSPSEARKKLNIVHELEYIALDEPDIVELANLSLQSITQTGLYFESAPKAWMLLRQKLNADESSDDFSGIFIGIGHDNPHTGEVAPDQVRFSAGVALVGRELKIERILLQGGRYARFRYVGKPSSLGLAYHYIYGKWAEISSVKINHALPAFMAYDHFPDGLKEHKILIHVPVN